MLDSDSDSSDEDDNGGSESNSDEENENDYIYLTLVIEINQVMSFFAFIDDEEEVERPATTRSGRAITRRSEIEFRASWHINFLFC